MTTRSPLISTDADFSSSDGPLFGLYRALRSGALDRRSFIARATAVGMALPLAAMAANMQAAASEATPSASPVLTLDAGTDGKTRGAGGELRILQWQAPTTLSSHGATGKKDKMAAALVSEPLMSYGPDGSLIARLVTEVPSIANGLLAADLTRVTYRLLPDVTWSDGEPFTAHDVVFTWQWLIDPANPTAAVGQYEMIERIEAEDDFTATITYTAPQPGWYVPFTGTNWGVVYPRHILDGGGQEAHDAFSLKPIGTGPYVVESFAAGDQVVFAANERYREPNKPFFSRVVMKGGGDATSAARAVVQTGEYAFAPALQLEPEVLAQIEATGDKGRVEVLPGSNMERLVINFADPHTEVDGERAHLGTPHPFFTDLRVRRAFSLAIDKQTLADKLFLEGELPASNFLVGVPEFASPNNQWVYDPEEANRLLDEAGWLRDRNVRQKDGIELAVTYATSVNAVRQKTQQVIKANWEAIGVKTELIEVDPAIYFDGSPGNEQSMRHFYNDVQMWSDGLDIPFPLNFMLSWYAGPDNENIASKANDWFGVNQQRYVNPEFDALFEEAGTQTDPQRLDEIFVRMNDIVVQDVAGIPLIQRSSAVFAIANSLNPEAIFPSSFEQPYWNIANWTATPG
ncbi:MAG TPA: peptide ABC transporter substrate-binding protein [Thermomicrobiales bacterium]|nr:peptide ABC transporter substrate-binding protein [Thermomicrobiales bacterium]